METFKPVEVIENDPVELPIIVLAPALAAKVTLPSCSKLPESVVAPLTPKV